MSHYDAILKSVEAAIDQVNLGRRQDKRVGKTPATPLLGPGSALDSLGLVNLVVAVEEQMAERFGVEINLAGHAASSQEQHPLTSVDTLVRYIETVVGGAIHG